MARIRVRLFLNNTRYSRDVWSNPNRPPLPRAAYQSVQFTMAAEPVVTQPVVAEGGGLGTNGKLALLYGVGARLKDYGASMIMAVLRCLHAGAVVRSRAAALQHRVQCRNVAPARPPGDAAPCMHAQRANCACSKACVQQFVRTTSHTWRRARLLPGPSCFPMQRKPWAEVLERGSFARPANLGEVRTWTQPALRATAV